MEHPVLGSFEAILKRFSVKINLKSQFQSDDLPQALKYIKIASKLTSTLQARIESNLRKILQKNRRCHFDKHDAPIWKLALFSLCYVAHRKLEITLVILLNKLNKKAQKNLPELMAYPFSNLQ